MEKVRSWCGQPSDPERLKNGTEPRDVLADTPDILEDAAMMLQGNCRRGI